MAKWYEIDYKVLKIGEDKARELHHRRAELFRVR
jgi:hypothetical protein